MDNYLKKKYLKSKKVKSIQKLKNKKYDLIVAADVIEHIQNDKKAIKDLTDALKRDGKILITVPAFQFLFSKKILN